MKKPIIYIVLFLFFIICLIPSFAFSRDWKYVGKLLTAEVNKYPDAYFPINKGKPYAVYRLVIDTSEGNESALKIIYVRDFLVEGYPNNGYFVYSREDKGVTKYKIVSREL